MPWLLGRENADMVAALIERCAAPVADGSYPVSLIFARGKAPRLQLDPPAPENALEKCQPPAPPQRGPLDRRPVEVETLAEPNQPQTIHGVVTFDTQP
jgi:hypothetical protein